MYFKRSKIQMVQTDYQKTRTCINSTPLNIINENEQISITINKKFSTSHHITKSTILKVNFVLLCFLLQSFILKCTLTHAITPSQEITTNHI